MNVSFLSAYEGYMRNKLCNQTNTIHKSMKFIRTFVNRAITQGLIDEYPFKHYKLKTVQTQRSALTREELKELEFYLNEPIPSYHRKYLKIFIFCCHSGLRYQDVKDLRYGNIDNNFIRIIMHKTKDIVSIPLTHKAKELIDYGAPEELVFKVPTNQVINKYLKVIFEKKGIKKNLSFHSSRHTFAVVGITLGIPIEIIAKLMGHRDLKTTQIYAQVVDQVKVKEMNKWNKLEAETSKEKLLVNPDSGGI